MGNFEMEGIENTERHIFKDFSFINTKDRTAIAAQITGAAMAYMQNNGCTMDQAAQEAVQMYLTVLQHVQMLGQRHE